MSKTISQLCGECEKCPHRDSCDEKRMELAICAASRNTLSNTVINSISPSEFDTTRISDKQVIARHLAEEVGKKLRLECAFTCR